MGIKAEGKKGKADAKLAARAAKRAKKLAAKSASLGKKEKVGKSKTADGQGDADGSDPATTTRTLTNSLQHGKWPALFKKHIGLIEAHIKTLDRLMQSMKSQMAEMEESERIEWETGEKGNWRTLCDMMDRSREVLTNARISARDIIPADAIKHKAGLDISGETFEPLGPKLEKRATELKSMREAQITEGGNGDEDTEMSDAVDSSDDSNSSSSSNSDDEEIAEQSFIPLVAKSKKRKASDSAAGRDVEPNPYFVVDTDPTPVTVISSGSENKERKKKSKSKSKSDVEQPLSNAEQAEVDFTAIQAQLQAEVEAGLKAQQEAESEAALTKTDSKKDKKKRKRHSEGLSTEGLVVEKKARKEKSAEKDEKSKKKRRASESTGEAAVVDGYETKKKRKKQHKNAD